MEHFDPLRNLLGFLIFVFATFPSYAQDVWNLAECATGRSKTVGNRLRFIPERKAGITRGHDIDYGEYHIYAHGRKKRGPWIHGIYGPHGSSGEPDRELSETTIIANRVSKDAGLTAVDIRGKDQNGYFWRFIGMPTEQIKYSKATASEAEYFNRMLDGVCYVSWRKIVKN